MQDLEISRFNSILNPYPVIFSPEKSKIKGNKKTVVLFNRTDLKGENIYE